MELNPCAAAWTGLDSLRPVVLSFASRRCRDRSEAEDVVQETLLRAARYRSKLTDPERLDAWVLRIAANVHRDLCRREVRYARGEDPVRILDGASRVSARDDDTSDDHLEGERLSVGEAMELLPRAMAELRREDRAVLERYYHGPECCLDLARHFRISRGLAKVRLFRARRRLLGLLRQRIASGCSIALAGAS